MHRSIRGSCLCGRVSFKVHGPFRMFHWCHCSQCRKATGSAHAANLFTAPENLTWTTGGDTVQRYRLTGDKTFNKCFCSNCGSPLPYLNSSGKYLAIPAGVLDEDPGFAPQDNIFWRDRAPWYEAGINAVKVDQYPE